MAGMGQNEIVGVGSGGDVLLAVSHRPPPALIAHADLPKVPKVPQVKEQHICNSTGDAVYAYVPRNGGRSRKYQHGWLSDT